VAERRERGVHAASTLTMLAIVEAG